MRTARKFLVGLLAAALGFVGAISAPTSPAFADYTALSCTYTGGAAHIDGGNLHTSFYDGDRFEGVLYLNDSGNRAWHWRIDHNGVLSDQGNVTGDFNVVRTFINFSGTDHLHAEIDNSAGTVHCWANANW